MAGTSAIVKVQVPKKNKNKKQKQIQGIISVLVKLDVFMSLDTCMALPVRG